MTEADKNQGHEGQGKIQGEGDYVAGRRFQDAERSFVAKGDVERKAREAEKALEGPEAEALERARRETGKGKVHAKPDSGEMADASDPHVEENLDEGIEETFPASDPVSISRGAD